MAERESEKIRQHLISLDPIPFFSFVNYSFFNAYFHYALNPHFIIGGGVQIPDPLSNEDISGIGVHPDIQYSFGSDPFKGFFVGGGGSYDYISHTETILGQDTTNSYSEEVFAVKAFAGYYIEAVEKGFTTAIMAGGEWNIAPSTDSILGLFSNKEGIVPYLLIRIGYAW